MLQNETASLDEVAAALGRPAGWLRRNWLRIHLDFGFPRKHPTGWTWPAAAVAAWLRASAAPAVPDNDNPAGDRAWEDQLDNRYGGNA